MTMMMIIIIIISVITGANGTISKSFRKYLNNILAKQKSKSCRKQPYWALQTYTSESTTVK